MYIFHNSLKRHILERNMKDIIFYHPWIGERKTYYCLEDYLPLDCINFLSFSHIIFCLRTIFHHMTTFTTPIEAISIGQIAILMFLTTTRENTLGVLVALFIPRSTRVAISRRLLSILEQPFPLDPSFFILLIFLSYSRLDSSIC